MTDLEITKLCAEAMGLKGVHISHDKFGDARVLYVPSGNDGVRYNPLHDDAQAMALVKKLRLSVIAAPMAGWIVHNGEDATFTKSVGTDLNRAICECVAKMKEIA